MFGSCFFTYFPWHSISCLSQCLDRIFLHSPGSLCSFCCLPWLPEGLTYKCAPVACPASAASLWIGAGDPAMFTHSDYWHHGNNITTSSFLCVVLILYSIYIFYYLLLLTVLFIYLFICVFTYLESKSCYMSQGSLKLAIVLLNMRVIGICYHAWLFRALFYYTLF